MDFSGLFADHFMPDKLHAINLSFMVDKLSVQFGGTAGNIAYNLALLEEEPEIISTAGNDFGSYKTHLLRSGVNVNSIRILEDRPTAAAFILTDKADNQIAAFHYGAGEIAYDTSPETEGVALAIVAPGCIPDMRDLPAYYRQRRLKYAYDPAQQIPVLDPEVLKDGILGAHILFGSDYEYALIKQKTGLSDAEILAHVPTVVVTYGAQGSDIMTAAGTTRVKACPAKEVVDPTGAGDAYRAGFVKGMFKGVPLTSCAQLASTVAAFVVESYGTQNHRFTLDELGKRYTEAYKERFPLT